MPLQRDWRVINHALNAPRYEMAVASIPISRVKVKGNRTINARREGARFQVFEALRRREKMGDLGFGIWKRTMMPDISRCDLSNLT